MRFTTFTLAIALGLPLTAQTSKTDERLDDAASLFQEIMDTPDKAIPQDLLDKSHCIVLVPGLKKGGLVIAAKYGRGFSLCRSASGQGWGPPAAIRVEGGGVGLQIGVSSTDVILLVMNEQGMKKLTRSKFTIGGDATAAAGPVGRNVTAQTDAFMHAEMLSWSRSRGLFAGVSLDGATLRDDLDENKAMYGQSWGAKDILTSAAKVPAGAEKLLAGLNKYSARRVK